MGLLSRVRRREAGGAAAGAGPPAKSVGALRGEIATLTGQNHRRADRDTERRLLALRQDAGIAETRAARGSAPRFAAPTRDGLLADDPIVEVGPGELTPGNLRAGILESGCVLVRQLIPEAQATRFAVEIERAWAARDRLRHDGTDSDGYYEEFPPRVGTGVLGRPWLEKGGNLLAADSPRLFFEMIELFVHQTATDPAMTQPRYAIENWFFGASQFPEDYAPLAV